MSKFFYAVEHGDLGAIAILAVALLVGAAIVFAISYGAALRRLKSETSRRRVAYRPKLRVVHPPTLRPHKPGDHTDTIPPAAEERNGRIKCVALVALFLLAAAPARAERWAVKTLTDQRWTTVDFHPKQTTIRALRAFPVPQGIYGPAGRIHRMNPVELTVWRIRARLVSVEREPDGDIHLVLAEPDDPAVTMIAEVPAPGQNVTFAAKWRAIRRDLHNLEFAGKLNVLVEVEGVGFFDFVHDQPGVAPSGVELHPVMKLTVLP